MKLRVVSRTGFISSKLIVQKLEREPHPDSPGIWFDKWVDCNSGDATDVILTLFCKSEKENSPPSKP